MSLCSCPERPRCQMYGGACGNYADWIEMQPASWTERPVRLQSVFTCKTCWDSYCDHWHKPIPGLTRPEWADADWTPSIMASINLARLANEDRERKEHEKAEGRVIRELSPRNRQ